MVTSPAAFDVGGPRFQPAHVRLLQPQLGGVLDGHHALLFGNESGQGVEQRCLAAAGAARNQDIQPGAHARRQEIDHFRGQRLLGHQVLGLDRPHAEAADRHHRAIQGQRRNDGVDAAAVRQSAVHHGTGLIDAPPGLAHDPLNDVQQVVVVVEGNVGPLQLAAALHVNGLRAVDEDVGDGRVLQQRFERAQPERLVEHLVDQPLALLAVEQVGAALAHFVGDAAHLLAQMILVHPGQHRQVHAGNDDDAAGPSSAPHLLAPGNIRDRGDMTFPAPGPR